MKPPDEDEPIRLPRSYHPPCSRCGSRHSPFCPCPDCDCKPIAPWVFPTVVTLGIILFAAAFYAINTYQF